MQRRIDMGNACLRAVDPSMSLDSETAAKDAISNIVTVVVGPPGVSDFNGIALNYEALERAGNLLDDAFESWKGDAEDYHSLGDPVSGLSRVRALYDARAAEYRKTVEPGVSDNSVLEGQLEVLHDVIGILEDAEAEGGS